jgi:hypothetical protein
MRVVLSVQEGKISSATLLRRLSTHSRRNKIYTASVRSAVRSAPYSRLHSSGERQRKLADAVSDRARAALRKTAIASGTKVPRSPGQMP